MIDPSWLRLDPKLSWDGVLTFVGGALALFGIWRQTRHTDEGLRKQVEHENQVRETEKQRRKESIATALLFEIDSFYQSHVRDFLGPAANVKPSELPFMRSISRNPFPLYEANAGSICELPAVLVADIVKFYGLAEDYLCDLRDYREAKEAGQMRGDPAATFVPAWTIYQRILKAAPGLAKSIHLICEKLCALTGAPYEWPPLAIAKEGLSTSQIVEALVGKTGQ